MDVVQYEYETLDEICRAFTEIAEALCAEIDAFRPDLVVALAHSGWLPVAAARHRWQHTRRRPFPPVARTNIGREKTALFESLPNEQQRVNWDMGVSNRDAAYLMYQAEGKTDWSLALRQQVEEVLGEGVQPERLLFVDEFSYSGKTAFLVLDLAEQAFPQSTIRLVSGNLEGIAEGLMRAWLRERFPSILEFLPYLGKAESAWAYGADQLAVLKQEQEARALWRASLPESITPEDLGKEIASLVPGTEDVSPSSLDWRVIQPGGSTLEALEKRKLPIQASEWLELPAWAEGIIMEAALTSPRLRMGAYSRRIQLAPHRILPEQRILARAFRQGVITRQQAAAAARLSPASAGRVLSDLVDNGDLFPLGYGAERVYHLAPNMFGEPPLPGTASLFDQQDAFWLIPGRWLIVPRPLSNQEEYDEWLAENRINHFFYLDQPERDNPGEYRKRLEAHWPPPLPKVRITGLGQTFYPDTNPEGLTLCLDQIRRALQRGDKIVLCDTSSSERSGLLAAAYLIGEGNTPESAFRKLDELRSHLPGAWRPYPPRSWMRTLVRRWANLK
jgi:hypothetical protein